MRALFCSTMVALLANAAAAGNVVAADASDAVAIDVLLHPDAAMLKHAQEANDRLRENYPAGFALDAQHTPHISMIQRFVRRDDLENVYAAIAAVVQKDNPAKFELEAYGYYYLPVGKQGLAGIVIRPTAKLLELQQKIIVAVEPFTVKEGTAAAFVQPTDGATIAPSIVDYVNHYVPRYSGKNFNPHLTVGLGTVAFAKELVAAPFKPFQFQVTGVSIYHLGNFGTAQVELWSADRATTAP